MAISASKMDLMALFLDATGFFNIEFWLLSPLITGLVWHSMKFGNQI